jgi:hypothetical protein
MTRKYSRHDPRTVSVMATLGTFYCDDGRPKDGIPLIEEAFDVSHWDRKLAWVLGNLQNAGIRMIDLQRYADAEDILVKCVGFHDKFINKMDSPLLTSIRLFLGVALVSQKKSAEAESYLSAAEPVLRTGPNRFPPDAKKNICDALKRLVALYESAGNKDAASKWQKHLGAFSVSETKQ